MGYSYWKYDVDSNLDYNLNSYEDCVTVKRLIKKLYENILGLTKATPLHQKKLYGDFISYCNASDDFDYKKSGLNIEKRRKELNYLHLKKHMETELTKDEVLQVCNNLVEDGYEFFGNSIFNDLKGFVDGKIQIKELLISLHKEYENVCIIEKRYKKSVNYVKEEKDVLDERAKALQKPNKMILDKYKFEGELCYLCTFSADIFAILSYEQSDYLQYTLAEDEIEKNEYEKIDSFVSSSFEKNTLDEILKRYNVSNLDELCKKYDKIRKQFETALNLKKEDIKIRILPPLAAANWQIESLYNSGFFPFPPSIDEMKELINNRIVNCAPIYNSTTPKSFEYETKLLEFYKKGCKELSEEQVVSLYRRIKEKIDFYQKSNISSTEDEVEIKKIQNESEESLKKYQKVFVEIILEKRKITNATESNYIQIIKDVLKDPYDYINGKYTSETFYVDSEAIDKSKKNKM